jgi:glycosyltransferase involved in cell wall biosynthesis
VLKIYVHSEDLQSIKNKWICDVLKSDFLQYSQTKIVGSPREADIIWLLAPWAHSKIDEQYLKNKFVITTIHHIDESKYPKKKEYFNYIDSITNRYHTICDKSKVALKKRTNKEVITANFWIDETTFFNIPNKQGLRAIYSIPENAFVVGSFQKDSEGKNLKLPKLSKGPDIFIKIIEDLKNKKQNIHVVLTGWRRNYIIKELERIKVSYSFFEMVNSKELNELYNCLDLYIVSSRVEGGPRSIIECGLAKAPIISTDVGISELILNKESIFDVNDFITYRSATPNVNYSYKKAKEYTISNYMQSFIKNVFFEIKQH